MQALGLLGLLFLALTLPFSVRYIEERLEAFFLLMGVAAVSLQGAWSWGLLKEALREPWPICTVVLVAGLAFRAGRQSLRFGTEALLRVLGVRGMAFALVAGLGLLSAFITSIVAALMLAEAVSALKLPRRSEVRLVILACFSIGAGAVLTPLGEPLTVIAISRLQGDPYHADFFFFARLLGPWLFTLMGIFAVLAALLVSGAEGSSASLEEDGPESLRDVLLRTVKVFCFVAGLVFFGHGFAPLAGKLLEPLSDLGLYWANTLSAVLDNATLAAIELGPQLSLERIRAAMLGLLVGGGMLVPGNIPNIICATKLRIGAKEWAVFGVPLGLAVMTAVFLVLWFF